MALVLQMLQAKDRRAKVLTEAEGTYLDSRMAALDRRIDELVYAAYGLDDADARVIEATVEERLRPQPPQSDDEWSALAMTAHAER